MDKIDPGPGYRLLGVDEPWTGRVEVLCTDKQWRLYITHNSHTHPYACPSAARVPVEESTHQKALIQLPPEGAVPPLEPASDKFFLNWIADRLVHVHNDPEGVDFVIHLRDIASKLPESPAPFTPNKYTRYIPTLDGRCVPVDVYCVSEAFPLANCLKSGGALDAVNHGRKKLLAPGQRGQKTALQDIKEAHASLGRAIALEEAATGREVQNG